MINMGKILLLSIATLFALLFALYGFIKARKSFRMTTEQERFIFGRAIAAIALGTIWFIVALFHLVKSFS